MNATTAREHDDYDQLLTTGMPGDHGTFTDENLEDPRDTTLRAAISKITVESVNITRTGRSVLLTRHCTMRHESTYRLIIDQSTAEVSPAGEIMATGATSPQMDLTTVPAGPTDSQVHRQMHTLLLLLKPKS